MGRYSSSSKLDQKVVTECYLKYKPYVTEGRILLEILKDELSNIKMGKYRFYKLILF